MKNVITRLLHLSLCLLFALLATAQAQAVTEVIDQVVAIVDDDIIMASELRERVSALTQSLQSRGVQMPPEDTLIRETLDQLILENIQLQMGRRAGVRIADEEINRATERIAAQNRMTLEQFQAALQSRGQSYENMREQVRREMIIRRVQMGNINQRVQITEEEVGNFMSTREGQNLTQPEFRLLHALIALPSDASPEQVSAASRQVDATLSRIRSGTICPGVVQPNSPPS